MLGSSACGDRGDRGLAALDRRSRCRRSSRSAPGRCRRTPTTSRWSGRRSTLPATPPAEAEDQREDCERPATSSRPVEPTRRSRCGRAGGLRQMSRSSRAAGTTTAASRRAGARAAHRSAGSPRSPVRRRARRSHGHCSRWREIAHRKGPDQGSRAPRGGCACRAPAGTGVVTDGRRRPSVQVGASAGAAPRASTPITAAPAAPPPRATSETRRGRGSRLGGRGRGRREAARPTATRAATP